MEERRTGRVFEPQGTFLLFIINLCRAGDELEYLFLLSTGTEGGDALVARAWGWQGRGQEWCSFSWICGPFANCALLGERLPGGDPGPGSTLESCL